MTPIYYHYTLWEETPMWYKVLPGEEKRFLSAAISFTGDHIMYGEWMKRVLHFWPISSSQNLTDLHQNRRAWIGHAACFIATGCPEYITRLAWGKLTEAQRVAANGGADVAIKTFEESYCHIK